MPGETSRRELIPEEGNPELTGAEKAARKKEDSEGGNADYYMNEKIRAEVAEIKDPRIKPKVAPVEENTEKLAA